MTNDLVQAALYLTAVRVEIPWASVQTNGMAVQPQSEEFSIACPRITDSDGGEAVADWRVSEHNACSTRAFSFLLTRSVFR